MMIFNVRSLCRVLLGRRFGPRLLMIGCLCAGHVSLAQEISVRVQRHLEDARECRESNDFDCARAALDNIATLELSRFERYQYWVRLGYIEFLDGDFPEAIDAYRNAAMYSPAQEQRQYHMRSVAQLHASLGQFQDAYDTLEELLVSNYRADPLAGRHLTDDGLWRGFDIYVTGDRDLFPLVRDQLAYPEEAVARGLSQGYVDVEFTVTRTGSTSDVRIVESSAPVFESAAIQAAGSFRYKPRLVDGEPVETVIQDRIEFRFEDDD